MRGKNIVKLGTNCKKTHPRFARTYKSGHVGSHLHAEMNVLRFSQPGDTLIVMRFRKDGDLSMAQPCIYCEQFIKEAKIKYVIYTDWDGTFKYAS